MLFRGDGDYTSRGQKGFETSRISAKARFFETSSVLSSVFKPAVGSTKDSTFSLATAVSDPFKCDVFFLGFFGYYFNVSGIFFYFYISCSI
jgi:hypothetical protein